MTYAVAQEIPGVTADQFARITAKLGTKAPDGLIVHASSVTPTGLRMIEVWESKQARDAYLANHVEPARVSTKLADETVDLPDHDHFEITSVQRLICGKRN